MVSNELHTAKVVGQVAGLTSRQLNDWDEKGVLGSKPRGKDGWRRFTTRELFVLMVQAELRRQFNIPLEKLKWVRDFMLQDGANHLAAATGMMIALGTPVFLITDLEELFALESATELANLLGHGAFSKGKGFVALQVNPLVRGLLRAVSGESVDLDDHGRGYEFYHADRQVLTDEERTVIEAVRTRAYQSIELVKHDGQLSRMVVSERCDDKKDLPAIVVQNPYQTTTIHTADGVVTKITRDISHKFRAKP